MLRSRILIDGYDLLGEGGSEGIRFAWKYEGKRQLLESAAFPQHRKGVRDNICGYTTSVSLGCILRVLGCPCRFCRTGTLLPYGDSLSAYDIAKQNIFMVLMDMRCSDHRELRSAPREFAYMGQGEPGYSYPQLREAIKITDYVMAQLKQTVHRHLISTSGVPEMIYAWKDDLKSGFYDERVTLHFSLHSVSEREGIMPIENKYPFRQVLDAMDDAAEISGEKPCIGILLFKDYIPGECGRAYTNELLQVKEILKCMDPQKFRLSFCEFNDSSEVGKSGVYDPETAAAVLEYALEKGYEAKLFSSFGKEKTTACGMLGGRTSEKRAGSKWLEIEKETEQLIDDAYANLHKRVQ